MLEYLKFLPLMQVVARHPGLVELFKRLLTEVPEVVTMANKLTAMVQPSIPEIQQAIAEAETVLQKIYASRKLSRSMPDVEFYAPKPKSRARRRRKRAARR